MPVEPLDQEIFKDGPLRVSRRRYGNDVVVFSLAGELDAANVSTARRVTAAAGAAGPDELLVVDLSALEFIDSSGIALLVSLIDAAGDGNPLRLVPSPSPAVTRVLKLTGVEAMVRVAHERPSAAA